MRLPFFLAAISLAACRRESEVQSDRARAAASSTPMASSSSAPAASTPSNLPSTTAAPSGSGGRVKGEEGTMGPSMAEIEASLDKAVPKTMRTCTVDADCVVVSSSCGKRAVTKSSASEAKLALEAACPKGMFGAGALGALPAPASAAKCTSGTCEIEGAVPSWDLKGFGGSLGKH